MPYCKDIEANIREIVKDYKNITSKKMFGGIAFMLDGYMLVGAQREHFNLRLSKEDYQEAMGVPYSKPFDITGRPMKGWIMLEGDKCSSDDYFYWIEKARNFVLTLPKKK